MIEFAGAHRLPLDGEHPVWAECTRLIAAAAHGELIELEQRAATPDPPTTAPSGSAVAKAPSGMQPTEKAVAKALAKLGPTIAGRLAAKLGCTVKAMSPVLAKLVKQGLVVTEGAHRSKQYSMAPESAEPPPADEQPVPADDNRQASLPLAAEPPPFADEQPATALPAAEPEPAPAPAPAPSVERRRRRPLVERPAAHTETQS